MQTEPIGTPEAEPASTASATEPGAFSARHYLDVVHPRGLAIPWQYCAPHLRRALDKTDDYGLDDLRVMVEEERAQFILEWAEGRPQSALVVQEWPLVRGKVLHVLALAGLPGKNFRYPNPESFGLLADLARGWGCSGVQGFAVESTARLWGRIEFKEIARLMRKSI